ncbi:caspase family protein [Cypionkella aquatica]|nr:caspase family protein [Cypionkella aquatica]
MLQLFRAAIYTILLADLPHPAHAELRAVLVGVSDYLTLDADLKGPANDVRLMAEALITRGIPATEITALTSDPTDLPAGVSIASPTKSAIILALNAMASRAQTGDTLVFYFSGHGAQAPDLTGDEGGGYDELLLPADAAGWKGNVGMVDNALLDDELQAWAQPLLTRGIKLVGLIDACHSDTAFRNLPGQGGVARGLGPQDLNIPDTIASAASAPNAPPLRGDFVFLYSSQSDQRSFEYPVGETQVWQGAFTRQLAATLRDSPTAPWAQVLAATAAAMQQGSTAQMPAGEGPMLDQNLFGTAAPQHWPIQNGNLQAGLLQGLNPGDQLSVYASAEGGAALLQVTLTDVAARSARLLALPANAAWAKLDQAAPPPPLQLAMPQLADPDDNSDYSKWRAALAPYVMKGGAADLSPIFTQGQIALAGPDGALDPAGPGSTPRIQAQQGENPTLAVERVLAAATHSLHLRRMFASLAGRNLTAHPALQLDWQRKATTDCVHHSRALAFDPAKGVAPCDQLWLGFQNVSGRDLDVSILYFNTDFSIAPIWPKQGLSNRLAAGESGRAGFQIDANAPPADEDILILAVPVEPGAARVDLTLLVDPATNRSFSSKPAPLLMIRQAVRIRPAQQGDE